MMISKNVSTLILAFVISAFSYVQAQRIEYQGKKYMVKGESIFLDKQDITTFLSYEDQTNIKSALSAKLANERITEAEKSQSRAEKAMKKAEKKRQKAEKALRKKDRAQDNLSDSKKKYKSANNKYEKRKNRGKLSPDDEAKWQKKLEKQEKDIKKDKKKLNNQS